MYASAFHIVGINVPAMLVLQPILGVATSDLVDFDAGPPYQENLCGDRRGCGATVPTSGGGAPRKRLYDFGVERVTGKTGRN